MAVANSHYEFTYYDVRTNSRISDWVVMKNTLFCEKIVNNQLDIIEPGPVSIDLDLEDFVGDDAIV